MAPQLESAYLELDEMFQTLKNISQAPTGNKEAFEKALISLNEQFQKILTRIEEQLQSLTSEDQHDDWIKLTVMKCSLIYEEGKIHLSAEKFTEAKEEMKKSLAVLIGVEADPFVCYLHMRIVNHLGFILSKLEDFGTAKIFLERILVIDVPENVVSFTTEELFAVGGINNEDSKSKMHNIYISNLQMLSWVYSKLGLETDSAKMQHIILEKEMEFEDCDPVDWAMRCTRVASLYLVRKDFVASRYYLSAATSALDRVEGRLDGHPDIGRAQAELARGWIYYGLKLFDVSRCEDINQMCLKIFDDPEPLVSQDSAIFSSEEPALDEAIQFRNSEVIVANVPAKPIQRIVEARHLFQHTQVWLKRARVYYTLRDHPYIYVNCVLDLSELYRFLAFYEPDLEAQYIVHKKRANALETLSTVLKEVRPQCYVAVSVDLLRELAEVQIELLGINLKKMYKLQNIAKESPESVKKRIENIYQIHSKLENVGKFLPHEIDEESHTKLSNVNDVLSQGDTIPGLGEGQVN